MRYFKHLLYFLLIIIVLVISFQFIINTKYKFPEPVVFAGENLYNPYSGIDSTNWKRANFHLHTRLFMGLTDGARNSVYAADSFYKFFEYDFKSISDYMHINQFNAGDKSYIPVYEHGYQYFKTHQMVLNAKKVRWIDYFFRQTLNNKQYIINRLKKDTSSLVVINHPAYRKAYYVSDFRYLGNYDCIEIANSKNYFTNYFDSALSGGHAVFLMADDDAHELSNMDEGAHSFNLIWCDPERYSALHALKTGKSYGVVLNLDLCKTNDEKKAAIKKIPVLTGFDVKSDSLIVKLNKNVNKIRFIGQNGITKKISENGKAGIYVFEKEDTYIRIEIDCADGSVLFLNPVFRYNGITMPANIPNVDLAITWTCRFLFAGLIILIFIIWIKRR